MKMPPSANPRSAHSLRLALGAWLWVAVLMLALYASLQTHERWLPHLKWLAYLAFWE